MARLPTPGADKNTWGDVLNSFLTVAHNSDGSLQPAALKAAGAVTAINGSTPDATGAVTIVTDNAASVNGVAISGTPATGQVLQATGTNTATWAIVTATGTVADATTGTKGIVQLAGDLAGTASTPTVARVRGVTVSPTAPASGQALVASSTSTAGWSTLTAGSLGALAAASNLSDLVSVPNARTNLGLGTAATISATAGGDLSGTLPTPTVAKVNGVAVSGTPSNGQVLQATSASAASWTTPAVSTPSDATTSTKGIIQLAGDLAGSAAAPSVAKVNGITVSGTPSGGQVLQATSASAATWSTPVSTPPSDATTGAKGIVQLAGDLAGTAAAPSVAKVNGITVSGTPSGGQVLTATGAAAASWQTPSAGGTSFTAQTISTSTQVANLSFVLGNAAAAGFTITLPNASNGAWVRVKKTDATVNAILVAGASGSTIDGGATFSINSQYTSQDFMSDGTNWYLI